MNDVLSRATAIKGLLADAANAASSQPIAEAVLACCSDLVFAGEADLACQLAQSVLTAPPPNDPEWVIRIQVVRARALALKGLWPQSLQLVRQLMRDESRALMAMPDDLHALRIIEASNLWQLNRVAEAVDSLLVIRSELLCKPDSYLLGWCSYQLSAAETMRGNYESARRFALDAVVSARRCGHPHLETHALLIHAMRERALCRWSSAHEAAHEAFRIADKSGFAVAACNALRAIAIIDWKRGRLSEAMRVSDENLRRAVAVENEPRKWLGALLKGMILLHEGHYEGARSLFTSGISWAVPEAQSRPSLLTTEFLGDIHLEQGDGAAALKLYDDVFPKAMALVPRGDIIAELRRRRAECYLLLGRSEDAYAEAKVGLQHCRDLGDRYEEAATYRVLALSAGALGKPAEAKQWFEQGFAYYDDIETPFEWGKLWLSYGDWLAGPHAAEFSDAKGALEAYRAAEDHFERMGAQAKLVEARRRIATLVPAQELSEESVSTTDELARPRRRPRGEAELERRSEWARESFGLVTRSRVMLDLLDDVAKLARSTTPILILGESGTGKELIASAIHRLSGRKGVFTPLNSAAIAREMFESELFGHLAGAFTGATRDKPGLMEVSDDGTVFLDEVAEMPMELQSRLLRFLETGEIRRIGATRNIAVDTRLVAATNRDRGAIERGEGFRPDLYYRLAHAVIELPPLRQRGDDVELLLDHFLEEFCRREGRRVRLSPAARARLVAYPWPGNVRQLRSLIKRVVILTADGHEIRETLLQLAAEQVPTTLLEEMEQAERGRIATALDQTRGSRTEAAKALGMKRTTLLNKMRRYGMR